jgi:hypothetical protein
MSINGALAYCFDLFIKCLPKLKPYKAEVPCLRPLLFFLIVRHPQENAWTLPLAIFDILLVWKKGKYLPRVRFDSRIALTLHWEGWQVSSAILKFKLWRLKWKWKWEGKQPSQAFFNV